MFFVDGLDVLFRIALGILKMNEAELLSCQSVSSAYVSLESLPTRMWQVEKLLQVRCLENSDGLLDLLNLQAEVDLRNSVVHSDIVKRRDTHVKELLSYM